MSDYTENPTNNPPEFDIAKIQEDVKAELEVQFESKLAEAEARAADAAATRAREEILSKLTDQDKKQTRWIPNSYEEIVERAKQETIQETQRMQEEQSKKIKEQEELATKEAEEKRANLEKYWNEQVETMTKDGRLPEIDASIQEKLAKGKSLSDDEKQQPGVQARQALYNAAQEHKEPNLELVYYKYLQNKPNRPVAPPVFGANKSVNTIDKPDYTYEEIANTSFEDLMK